MPFTSMGLTSCIAVAAAPRASLSSPLVVYLRPVSSHTRQPPAPVSRRTRDICMYRPGPDGARHGWFTLVLVTATWRSRPQSAACSPLPPATTGPGVISCSPARLERSASPRFARATCMRRHWFSTDNCWAATITTDSKYLAPSHEQCLCGCVQCEKADF